MYYVVPFDKISTSSTLDTYTTLVALIVPDTAGYRCRLRDVVVGPSDGTPMDVNLSLRIQRILDVSAGTAGTPGISITGANIPKGDPGCMDSIVTAVLAYTGEPTTFETRPLWAADMNGHNTIMDVWDEDKKPIIATQDMLIALRAAPRTAGAVKLTGHLGFNVY